MFKIILVAVLAVSFVEANQKAYTTAKIVPSWLPKAPSKGMTLEFPSSADNVKATYGNKLAIADVSAMPFTQWEMSESSSIKYYTLMAVDLDADNSSAGSGYLLWLNTNISGDYAGELDLEYQKPTGTNHRVVFLVYTQKAFIEFDASIARENFNISKYASKKGLTLWAGNFFYTK